MTSFRCASLPVMPLLRWASRFAKSGDLYSRVLEVTRSRTVTLIFKRLALRGSADCTTEGIRSGLGPILELFVPCHLNRFQFPFVRSFGISGEIGEFGDVTMKVSEANGERIEFGVDFRKQDADVFGVVPGQFF